MQRPRLATGLSADRAAGLVLMGIGALAIIESRGLPMGTLHEPGPAYFPVALSIVLIAFGAILALFAGGGAKLKELGWEEARHALLILAGAGVAVYFLERVGYVISMTALMLYLLIVVARRHWAASVLFAVALAGGTFALFDLALRVLLPRSPWGFF